LLCGAARGHQTRRDTWCQSALPRATGCRLTVSFERRDSETGAYESHDVGTTPPFGGDTAKALASITARALILTGTKDLLNPEFESQAAGARNCRRPRCDDLPRRREGTCVGGRSRGLRRRVPDREAGAFLGSLTGHGKD